MHGKPYPIVRFDVWWDVEGLGLYSNLDEAMKMDRPVRAVSVAVGQDTMYEVLS